MPNVLRIVLAALLAVSLAAGPAAACCTDLWSCAGAVATAGLSCAEEAAVLALRDLARRIEAERDSETRGYAEAVANETDQANRAADAWRKIAEDAAADAARSARRASEIAGDDVRARTLAASSLARTPTPASSRLGSLDTMLQARSAPEDATLNDLKKKVEAEQRETDGLSRSTAESAAKARTAIEDARVWQLASLSATAVATWGSLLAHIAALLGQNDKLKAIAEASTIAALVAEFVKLEGVFERELAAAAREGTRRREAAADLPRASAGAAEQHAAKARQLLAAMERVARVASLAQRPQTARDLLVAPTPGPAIRAASRVSSQATASFLAAAPARIAALKASARALPSAARAPDVAPFRARVDADLAARFRGLAPADAARARDALLAEARRRYASDPKTLAGVEKLVVDAAARR